MRIRTIFPFFLAFVFVFVFLYLLTQTVPASQADDGWVLVANGIEYKKFSFPSGEFGPNEVYVTRMDRNNPNVTIDSTIAQGRLTGGLETMTGQFNRYEDTINYWGEKWGNRSDVVVAINGYFYGSPAEPPGVPWRGQIHSGWYAKRHDDLQNGSGFAWKLNRTTFIGECVFHQLDKQLITFAGSTESTLKITDINTARGDDQLILYTPQYDVTTKTGNDGVEVLVEMVRPNLILPLSLNLAPDWFGPLSEWLGPLDTPHRIPEAEALGYVRKIANGEGSMQIPFDHVVLSATGVVANKLLENMQIDKQIGISQSVTHYEKDTCGPPVLSAKDWTKTYASIGGSFYFLKNSTVPTFDSGQANVKDARTAIAFNDQYVYFIVVDQIIFGDDVPNDNIPDVIVQTGMNMKQLGDFAMDYLGATEGIAQDGGGSSTMVIHGKVVNVPNDFDADITQGPCEPIPTVTPTPTTGPTVVPGTPSYLPLIQKGAGTPGPTSTPTVTPPAGTCYKGTQRLVANGMMMVVVQPMVTSTKFTVGQAVTTNTTSNLRQGPGLNYAVFSTPPAGSSGVIKSSLTKHNGENLNGVFATGNYWWQVNFGGQVGWISESLLTTPP